ncbi:MAG: hypothetical protein ACRDND_30125 [Streptosporangiaceae bacterium]
MSEPGLGQARPGHDLCVNRLAEVAEVGEREERGTARMRPAGGQHTPVPGRQDLGLPARPQRQQFLAGAGQALQGRKRAAFHAGRVAAPRGRAQSIRGRCVHRLSCACAGSSAHPGSFGMASSSPM